METFRIRRDGLGLGCVLPGLVALAWAVGGWVVAAVRHWTDPALFGVLGLFTVWGALTLWWLARPDLIRAVRVTPNGLHIVHYLRRATRVPWDDIRALTLRRTAAGPVWLLETGTHGTAIDAGIENYGRLVELLAAHVEVEEAAQTDDALPSQQPSGPPPWEGITPRSYAVPSWAAQHVTVVRQGVILGVAFIGCGLVFMTAIGLLATGAALIAAALIVPRAFAPFAARHDELRRFCAALGAGFVLSGALFPSAAYVAIVGIALLAAVALVGSVAHSFADRHAVALSQAAIQGVACLLCGLMLSISTDGAMAGTGAVLIGAVLIVLPLVMLFRALLERLGPARGQILVDARGIHADKLYEWTDIVSADSAPTDLWYTVMTTRGTVRVPKRAKGTDELVALIEAAGRYNRGACTPDDGHG